MQNVCIKCNSVLWRLIWDYNICRCPFNGTPGLNWLTPIVLNKAIGIPSACLKCSMNNVQTVDPDKCAPLGTVQSGITLFAQVCLSVRVLSVNKVINIGWTCCRLGEALFPLFVHLKYTILYFKRTPCGSDAKYWTSTIHCWRWIYMVLANLFLPFCVQVSITVDKKRSWSAKNQICHHWGTL